MHMNYFESANYKNGNDNINKEELKSRNSGIAMLNIEQLDIKNLIRINKGKIATIYMSFPNSSQWKDKTFAGIIEGANNDYIIISDSKTGKWYLLLTKYLDFIDFDEKINHDIEYYITN